MAYVNSDYLKDQFENFSDRISEIFARKEDISADDSSDGGGTCRSIESIRLDDNNNVWVKYDDGTPEENVGQLNVNVEADFLTVDGFGKLRYYQNRFQYYNDNTQDWVDTIVTPDNIYVVNMNPLPMELFIGIYDEKTGYNKLKWTEPQDTIIDGQAMCIVESIVIRRKKDFAPSDITDGDLVIELPRKLFGKYKNNWFRDDSFKPNRGDIYYYKAFPTSATTDTYSNSTLNEIVIKSKDYELYGFEINQNESDPDYMITYIEDNENWDSAYMDYDKDEFNYGDWTPENAFFMNVRPCVLRRDTAQIYCYLNPNDYTYQKDGGVIHIEDFTMPGNVMIQFPKIYWKITDLRDGRAQVRFTNKNFDGTYHCWSHIDADGNEIPYCYMPAYNGYNDKNVRALRSLSNKVPISELTVEEEITMAINTHLNLASVTDGNKRSWYTEIFADRMLVNLLLLLIGKNTNTQKIFGMGNVMTGGQENKLKTGTMNDKGLFWGENTGIGYGVKVFGMENWWGNVHRRIAGRISDHGVQKVKMTYGTTDGSTAEGYNLDGTGYIEVNSTIVGTELVNSYISSMTFSDYGFIPKSIEGGSVTTYYPDGVIYNNEKVCYALVGGSNGNNTIAGALREQLATTSDTGSWHINASVSCKPLLSIQESDPNLHDEEVA